MKYYNYVTPCPMLNISLVIITHANSFIVPRKLCLMTKASIQGFNLRAKEPLSQFLDSKTV